jgi:hypothetical protein
MSTLRTALNDLASNFADAVLAAIRGASLQELLAESGGAPPRRGPGRPRGSSTKSAPTAARSSARAHKPAGRLRRRTPEEVAKSLAQVVALVRKSTGMRTEEIQKALKLDKREVPRILHEGLKGKKLKKKGQRRATVYSAA